MPKPVRPSKQKFKMGSLEHYFVVTGFYDLLPKAVELARKLGYDESEMIEAVCKVFDKSNRYPPAYNRAAWFMTVFAEKLSEARSDILAFRAMKKRNRETISGSGRTD